MKIKICIFIRINAEHKLHIQIKMTKHEKHRVSDSKKIENLHAHKLIANKIFSKLFRNHIESSMFSIMMSVIDAASTSVSASRRFDLLLVGLLC